MSDHAFINQHENCVVGRVVAKGIQPFTGTPLVRIEVTEGKEKGMLYWVPEHQVRPDGILGVIARL